jgi:ribonuclease R
VDFGHSHADVAHYVTADSPIDREARKRGTSVYLGEQVIPMLPDAIAGGLCAFQVGEERLAVSVLVMLDREGRLVEYELQPAVIRVNHQLSYQQAQAVLARSSEPNPEIEQFSSVFELLDSTGHSQPGPARATPQAGAFELKPAGQTDRQQRGLQLGDTSQLFVPKFHYDDEGALSAMVVTPSDSDSPTIAEVMLLANQIVATHCKFWVFPASTGPPQSRSRRCAEVDEAGGQHGH